MRRVEASALRACGDERHRVTIGFARSLIDRFDRQINLLPVELRADTFVAD